MSSGRISWSQYRSCKTTSARSRPRLGELSCYLVVSYRSCTLCGMCAEPVHSCYGALRNGHSRSSSVVAISAISSEGHSSLHRALPKSGTRSIRHQGVDGFNWTLRPSQGFSDHTCRSKVRLLSRLSKPCYQRSRGHSSAPRAARNFGTPGAQASLDVSVPMCFIEDRRILLEHPTARDHRGGAEPLCCRPRGGVADCTEHNPLPVSSAR